MPRSAASADPVVSSALWARSFAINLLALAACRFALSGFEIHGVWAYALAAVGIELPTVLWMLAIQLWAAKAPGWVKEDASYIGVRAWVALLAALTLVVPLALATSLPGLLVAEWISPLTISGFWTYVAACAITTALNLAFRQSRPLRFMSAFIKGDRPKGTAHPDEA